jgi:Tol biopolymer transport system component
MGRSVWQVPLEGGDPVKVGDGYRMPAYSPDKKLIVARSPRNSGNGDVAIFSVAGGPPLKRIRLPIMEWQRIYWLNNHTVSFIKNDGGTSNIWSYDVNSDESKQLTNFNGDQIFTYAWSPDFKEIVCQRGKKLANVTVVNTEQ